MSLDLTSLEKALAQLKINYSYASSPESLKDKNLAPVLRSAAIQAFEFTYELSIKMLRRHLEAVESSKAVVDQLVYQDLIRTGAEKGLMDDPLVWFEFRKKRNVSAHTYDESKASDVFKIIPELIKHAEVLLTRLKEQN